MTSKEIPDNLAPIVTELREHIEYFDMLIADVPETDALRDSPEVLSRIKTFYSLCFYAMAQDLNNKLTDITGVESSIFFETFKAHGVEFHYNKLGRLAEQATSYIDLVAKMGVFVDIRATMAMPDISNNPDLLKSFDRELYCINVVANGPRVLQFLFPAIYSEEDIEGFPPSEPHWHETLLNLLGGALYRVFYVDSKSFDHDFAKAFTIFMQRLLRSSSSFDDSFKAIPLLNQDSFAERKVCTTLEKGSLVPDLIKAIFTVMAINGGLVHTNYDGETEAIISELIERDIGTKGVDIEMSKKVILVPTMKWTKPNLVSAQEAFELSDNALYSGQVFETVCVEFEEVVIAYKSISIAFHQICKPKMVLYPKIRVEFCYFSKFLGESSSFSLKLVNRLFYYDT